MLPFCVGFCLNAVWRLEYPGGRRDGFPQHRRMSEVAPKITFQGNYKNMKDIAYKWIVFPHPSIYCLLKNCILAVYFVT